jgi:hypothetical protein
MNGFLVDTKVISEILRTAPEVNVSERRYSKKRVGLIIHRSCDKVEADTVPRLVEP